MLKIVILILICVLLILLFALYVEYLYKKIIDKKILRGLFIIIVGILLSSGVGIATKCLTDEISINSNTEYIVKVYNANGDIIEKYEGKVTFNGDRIIVEDALEEHIIYCTSGTVIVEKVKSNDN